MTNKLTRRAFLRLTAGGSAAALVAACAGAPPAAPPAAEGSQPSEGTASETTGTMVDAAPGQYNEAPMLAELVAQGELPPVDQRLPASPVIVPVVAEIGNYGGVIRRGFKGVSDRWGPSKVQDSSLIRYDLELTKHPDLIESWEVNDDATEYTIHLRQGLKWSDGTEFDSSAFTWWYDNVLTDQALTPAPPVRYSIGDPPELMEMTAPDQYTVVFAFAQPKPLFIDFMSREQPFAPGHYMQQFHMALTDDQAGLEAIIDEAGFEGWEQYYENRDGWHINPDKPSVGPWMAQNQLSEELFVMVRNPYFHQVDAEGNQLPYVDYIYHRLFDTTEVLNLRILNGEIDFQARHVVISNFTLFKEGEEAGNYQLLLGPTSGGETLSINHAGPNERLNGFFQNRDVRRALNVAVDREQINQLVYDGLGVPRQASPSSQSPQYHEASTTAHAFYDPDMANQLLDDAGFAERDADGVRLWNDGSGEIISFIFEGIDETGTPGSDAAELVMKHLANVGIQAVFKPVERSLYEEHWGANQVEATWWGAGHDVLPFLSHSNYFIGELLDRPWAGAWGRWYRDRNDPNGAPPPEGHFLWAMWDLWAQALVEADDAERNRLLSEILDIWAEEVPVVGIVGELPGPIIAHKDLRNVTSGYVIQDATRDESLINPAQLFWVNPEAHA